MDTTSHPTRPPLKRLLVIVNPAAGKGSAARRIPELERLLKHPDLHTTFTLTQHPWHAAELARSAATTDVQAVIAAGGDGTVNEVINGLMHAHETGQAVPALGVLPIGRGNDFAFGAGLPTDWHSAIKNVLHGSPQPVDIGKMEIHGAAGPASSLTRYFGNGIGIGFDTLVNIEASKIALGGFLGYTVAALRTLLLRFQRPMLSIQADDEHLHQACIMVSIMNGRRMGGGFLMAPEAASGDGLLDICLAGKASRLTILGMLPRFMQGTQAGHPAVRFLRARQITVNAGSSELPVHADGETLTETAQHVLVKVLPGALRVLMMQPS